EEAEPLLEHSHRRIGVARIDEARAVIGEGGLRLLGRLVDVARAHIDRFAGLHELAAQMAGARQDGARVEAGRNLTESVGHGPCSSRTQACGQQKTLPQWSGFLMGAPTFLAVGFSWPQAGRLKSPRMTS